MRTHRLSLLLLVFFAMETNSSAQPQASFVLSDYKAFLASHQNMNSAELLSQYPAGNFQPRVKTAAPGTYLDSVRLKYGLTAYESSLLSNNGFAVTERLSYPSFGHAYLDIYHKDLPVYVTTDALLHAVHNSYDAILMNVEQTILVQQVERLLTRLHAQIPLLQQKYSDRPEMFVMLKDLDVYLTVPLRLFGGMEACVFPDQESVVTTLLNKIAGAQAGTYPLFSSTPRWIDFSQFTPRGHYTLTVNLQHYFRAMIWLGKTEFYLIAPDNVTPAQSETDIQRQIIDALLLQEAMQGANALVSLNQIDSIIALFAGEADNVTLPQLTDVRQSVSGSSAADFLSLPRCSTFQDSLKTKSFAFQRINSQILISSALNPDKLKPASSFLLLGQRFVVDSYAAGNVVYDNILYNGVRIWRPLPSTLDILFAIGNDAAAQLLTPELDKYHYASNLASLRYLIAGYDTAFWNANLYHAWLNVIRSLNPPADRSAFPLPMQTSAWWQQKMNTQLASWSQLRHDNLLYAKQSYTGGTTCSYPDGYVEPIPEFYRALKKLGDIGADKFRRLQADVSNVPPAAIEYFEFLAAIADTLGRIAEKERSHAPFSVQEKRFLGSMVSEQLICGVMYDGWYYKLFFKREDGFTGKDWIVADVHTCPTDAAGNPVGWVLHAGTGAVNMGFFIMENADGVNQTYAGPVMSYYEYVSSNFKRLTDEEWKSSYAGQSWMRPRFVNLYMADSIGQSKGNGPSLLTGVGEPHTETMLPSAMELLPNFPNPFNTSTIISFRVAPQTDGVVHELGIYDLNGRLVRLLVRGQLPAGAYAVRWDGTDEKGKTAASGAYFYRLVAGDRSVSARLSFIK
ncbi:MAG: DUF3160 domain-containing protein [Ignavibacteriales bacterium]|nr:DUF3160 domain-containing protein [Ignavibacteriales bacterium]